MSNNSLKSVEDMAAYFKEKLNEPNLTIDSWYNENEFIQKMYNNMMSNTKSNIIIIDDLEVYNNNAMYNVELLFKSMNNPDIKLDVGHDRYDHPYIYLDSNNHEVLIELDTQSLKTLSKFFQNKIQKVVMVSAYNSSRKLFLEGANNGVFKFSSPGTKPLFMNSRDMATLSIFFENCLIDKLLDM